MSTNKTSNLNLHKWVGTDYVKRTEFNENFDTIDNEITTHETQKASEDSLGHVKVDGETIIVDGDGVISYNPLASIGYNGLIYDEGDEYIAWEIQETSRTDLEHSTHIKEDNYLYLYAGYSNSSLDANFITEAPINLTNVNTVYFDWEGQGSESTHYFDIVGADYVTYFMQPFSRRVESIDVSDINGEYKLRFRTRDSHGEATRTSETLLYKVWCE